MNTVFGKNTTSASITVAGHKVYYIDSTDAEIVEVEGTVGEPLPSVGDTVTFGNYPQATSTPDPIRWKVLEVDSVNGKAFLIAVWVLDAQQFNSVNTYVAWENCSLRTWLNGTFFNAAFDSDEQRRIPLSHIENPSTGSTMGTETDDYVFCLSAPEASSYFASDSARCSAPTQHAIDAGVYYSTFARWWLRNGAYYYTKPYVEPNGRVYSTSGSQHVVYINGVRPAMWVNFSGVTTVKYNAFKYTLNGTPYWYVIDGTHDTWTDDLSAWGYTELQPVGDDPTKPLTFRATSDNSSVTLKQEGSPSGSFEYSLDGGSTWNSYNIDTAISLNEGDEVCFRAAADRTGGQTYEDFVYFEMSGFIEAWHNVESMLFASNYDSHLDISTISCAFTCLFADCTSLTKAPLLPATTLAEGCYNAMFAGCTSLTSAPNLPATTLAGFCYYSMFSGCTSLTTAPSLPATTLADYCYYSMFSGCTSLTTAPSLPATTLAVCCYGVMFYGCTSLTSAPSLPATTLAESCYISMFYDCTSLTSAPNLPATTLAETCYCEMFYGCTSLTTAPSLPATILTYYCYYSMFSGCSNLSYVECYATSFQESSCYEWLMNVSATGDFYADPNANWTTNSDSGIPSGWTRRNIT